MAARYRALDCGVQLLWVWAKALASQPPEPLLLEVAEAVVEDHSFVPPLILVAVAIPMVPLAWVHLPP